MESVNMQAVQAAMPAVQSMNGPAQQAEVAGDPFAALLLNLLGGNPEEGENPMLELLEGLPLFEQLQPQEEEPEDLTAAMEMMAELLMGQNGVNLPVANLNAEVAQALGITSVERQPSQLWQPAAQPQAVQPQEQASQQFGQVISAAYTAQEGGQEQQPQAQTSPRQDDFLTAVQQAKLMLQQEQRPEAVQALDVDQLQSQVDAGRFARTGKTAESAAMPQPQELVDQVRKGVFEQVFSGKEEFTVKLKPEGLGEITVKMVEREQGMTLQIITSSTQVAKMLTSELGALQNALRPYHAEVQEVVAQTQQSPDSNLAGGFANQDFGGHQHQQPQQQEPHTPFDWMNFGEEATVEAPVQAAPDSNLDAYI